MKTLISFRINSSSKSGQRGFTLIELLVVISIIGTLLSVVLAAVGGARDKGNTAAGKIFANHTRSALYDDAAVYVDFDDAGSLPTTSYNQGYLGGSMSIPAFPGITITTDTDLRGRGKQFTVSPNSDLHVNINDDKMVPFLNSGNYTITAWYKQSSTHTDDSVSDAPPIVGVGGNGDMGLATISAGVGKVYGHYTPQINTGFVTIKPGQWYQLALTLKNTGGQIKEDLYVNGRLSSTVSFAQPPLITNGFFGIGGVCCGFSALGSIDEVALYSKSLLAADIQNIFAAGAREHGLAVK